MKAGTIKGIVLWAPRVLVMLFIVFLSALALDVFDGKGTPLQTLIGFLIHLIPSAVITLALIIAWRWKLIGATAFFALALLYIVLIREKDPIATMIISGPLFLAGLLFLVGSFYNEKI